MILWTLSFIHHVLFLAIKTRNKYERIWTVANSGIVKTGMFYYSSKFSGSFNGLKSFFKKKEAGREPGESKGYFPKEGVVVCMAAKTSNTMKTLKCPLDLLSWMSLKT